VASVVVRNGIHVTVLRLALLEHIPRQMRTGTVG
jgi:hypothetical protein